LQSRAVISVDVSGWEPAGDEQLGTKPKQWLRDDAGSIALRPQRRKKG